MLLSPRFGQPKKNGRIGFTLIEVIFSVLLGGFVAASSAVIAVQCAQARKSVGQTIEQRWSRLAALSQFQQDCSYALRDKETGIPLIQPPTDFAALVEILTLAAAPTAASPFPRRLPALVKYRTEPSPIDTQSVELVRETQFLTDEQKTIQRMVLAERLSEANLHFYRDGSWNLGATTANPNVMANSSAVRLSLKWAGASEPSVTTFVITDQDAEDRR